MSAMRCHVRAAQGPGRQERASPASQVPAAPGASAHPAALQREAQADSSRRQLLGAAALLAAAAAAPARTEASVHPAPVLATVSGYTPMPSLKGKDYGKSRMTYSDYVTTPSGLQFKDIVEGQGAEASEGKTAVVDWSGVTIGCGGGGALAAAAAAAWRATDTRPPLPPSLPLLQPQVLRPPL